LKHFATTKTSTRRHNQLLDCNFNRGECVECLSPFFLENRTVNEMSDKLTKPFQILRLIRAASPEMQASIYAMLTHDIRLSKSEIIIGMVTRPGGVLRTELVAALGWPSVSVQNKIKRPLARLGYDVEVIRHNGETTRYVAKKTAAQ